MRSNPIQGTSQSSECMNSKSEVIWNVMWNVVVSLNWFSFSREWELRGALWDSYWKWCHSWCCLSYENNTDLNAKKNWMCSKVSSKVLEGLHLWKKYITIFGNNPMQCDGDGNLLIDTTDQYRCWSVWMNEWLDESQVEKCDLLKCWLIGVVLGW